LHSSMVTEISHAIDGLEKRSIHCFQSVTISAPWAYTYHCIYYVRSKADR